MTNLHKSDPILPHTHALQPNSHSTHPNALGPLLQISCCHECKLSTATAGSKHRPRHMMGRPKHGPCDAACTTEEEEREDRKGYTQGEQQGTLHSVWVFEWSWSYTCGTLSGSEAEPSILPEGAPTSDSAVSDAYRTALADRGGDRRAALRQAARALGMKRAELYRYLAELGETGNRKDSTGNISVTTADED